MVTRYKPARRPRKEPPPFKPLTRTGPTPPPRTTGLIDPATLPRSSEPRNHPNYGRHCTEAEARAITHRGVHTPEPPYPWMDPPPPGDGPAKD